MNLPLDVQAQYDKAFNKGDYKKAAEILRQAGINPKASVQPKQPPATKRCRPKPVAPLKSSEMPVKKLEESSEKKVDKRSAAFFAQLPKDENERRRLIDNAIERACNGKDYMTVLS